MKISGGSFKNKSIVIFTIIFFIEFAFVLYKKYLKNKQAS